MYGFTGAHIVVDVVGWIRKQTNNVLCAMCEVFVSKEKKVNAEAVRICSLPRG